MRCYTPCLTFCCSVLFLRETQACSRHQTHAEALQTCMWCYLSVIYCVLLLLEWRTQTRSLFFHFFFTRWSITPYFPSDLGSCYWHGLTPPTVSPYVTSIYSPARLCRNVNGSCWWEEIWDIIGKSSHGRYLWRRLWLDESYGHLGEESILLPWPSQLHCVTWAWVFLWAMLGLVFFNFTKLLWPHHPLTRRVPIFLWLIFLLRLFYTAVLSDVISAHDWTVHFSLNELVLLVATPVYLSLT